MRLMKRAAQNRRQISAPKTASGGRPAPFDGAGTRGRAPGCFFGTFFAEAKKVQNKCLRLSKTYAASNQRQNIEPQHKITKVSLLLQSSLLLARST